MGTLNGLIRWCQVLSDLRITCMFICKYSGDWIRSVIVLPVIYKGDTYSINQSIIQIFNVAGQLSHIGAKPETHILSSFLLIYLQSKALLKRDVL